jgi:hypothetical protein
MRNEERSAAPEPTLWEKLWPAVNAADIPACRHIILTGGPSAQEEMQEALRGVAKPMFIELCVLLIEQGTYVDADHYLVRAALEGDADLCRVFLDGGAHVDRSDSWGRTALMGAVTSGSVEVCELLLRHGAKVDTVSPFGSALMRASSFGRLDIVKLLLAGGASPDLAVESSDAYAENVPSLTPFQSAVMRGQENVVQYFLREGGEDIAQRTADGRTMLKLAGKHESVRQLLLAEKAMREVGASFNAPVAGHAGGLKEQSHSGRPRRATGPTLL